MFRFGLDWRAIGSGFVLCACVDLAGPIPVPEDPNAPPSQQEPSSPPANPSTTVNPSTPSNPPGPPPAGAGPEQVGFDADVHPILVERCGMCHGSTAADIPKHAAAEAEAAFQAVLGMSKGQPVYQRILARASGADPAGFMPPPYAGCDGPLGAGRCLTMDEFDLITDWVEQGAMRR